MPISSSAAWVRELRTRKEWSMEKLKMELRDDFHLNISRIEQGLQQPKITTLQSIGETLSVTIDDFICPILENQPANVYTLRYQLSQALQTGDVELAQNLYDEITRLPGFNTPINRQYLLSQKAQLRYLKEEPFKSLITVIHEGITQTLHKYELTNLSNALLVYEEPILFHLMAKAYLREGDCANALLILKGMRDSFNKLPIDDIERDETLAPILLTLSVTLIREGEYTQAIGVCDEGLEISATRNHGAYTPAFLHNKAICLRCLGDDESARKTYRLAFFGYEMLHKRNKAQEVLDETHKHNLTFETYGVEKLEYVPITGYAYKCSEMIPCKNIPELIKNTRIHLGLTQEDVFQGICSKSTYSKIENNRTEPNHYLLEAIFQRLGLDINLYCRFYLGTKNFEIYRQRERMHQLLIKKRYAEAEEMLVELEKHDEYKEGCNLQFLLTAKATFYLNRNGFTPEYLRMLFDALAVTWPDYNEEEINTKRLTHYETTIINQIAGYYYSNGIYINAEKICIRLIDKFNTQSIDETEKMKLYATVIYNYSSCLNEMKQYDESMKLIRNGIKFDRERGRFLSLSQLIYLWAFNLFDADRQKESVPFFAIAYYGSYILDEYGKSSYVSIISDHVEEHFNIKFE